MERIEKSKYSGYIWKSDQKEPEVIIEKEPEFSFDDNQNPFVVEGFLFDGKTSYSIRYVDGKHIVNDFPLAKMPKEYTEQLFIPSFKKGVTELKFRQYWKPEPDPLCEGMEVLKPAQLVFVGFNKKEG
jgi:CRISPR type III-associated protein (TIGR04423 family)